MNVSWAISCSLPLTHSIPLLTVNAIVGVLGSPGNFLVCLAIATNSRQHRSSNYLLFGLAITNLIDALICKPIVLDFISLLTFFHEWRTSNKQLVYHVLVGLSCQTSYLHLVTISIDRFVVVAFPPYYTWPHSGLTTILSISKLVSKCLHKLLDEAVVL